MPEVTWGGGGGLLKKKKKMHHVSANFAPHLLTDGHKRTESASGHAC